MASQSSQSSETKALVMCKYGNKCYRKNPQHFREFRHPFDLTGDGDDDKSDDNGQYSSQMTKKLKISDNRDENIQSDDNDNSPFNLYLSTVTGLNDKSVSHLSKSLRDILSASMGTLIESAQFNYLFDIDWLIEHYPPEFRTLPLLIVYGDKRDGKSCAELQRNTIKYNNIKLCGATLFDAFGTHHTKMMFLRYNNGLRVCIHTANLIPQDWDLKTQGIWLSPLFPQIGSNKVSTDVSQTNFKTDLIEYLNAYRSKELDHWINQIKRHDLSSAKVFLIGSVPGRHIQDNKTKFGHLKLRKVLSSFVPSNKIVDNQWPVIAQFSSIGSLGPSPDSWLCSEFLMSLSINSSKFPAMKAPLKLIFPTVDDVRNSLEGYRAGTSLPYSVNTAKKQNYLKSYLHSWKSELRGRTNASPHIKSYTRLSPDNRHISWFLLSSANLSKAAWGCLEKNGTQLAIKSYEIGVLFVPKLFGSQELFNVSETLSRNGDGHNEPHSFPLHYDIPLSPYSSTDEPWTWDEPHTDLPDRHGNAWIP